MHKNEAITHQIIKNRLKTPFQTEKNVNTCDQMLRISALFLPRVHGIDVWEIVSSISKY